MATGSGSRHCSQSDILKRYETHLSCPGLSAPQTIMEGLQDTPTLPWIIQDGGALDVDLCPPCWERHAHVERYEFACKALHGKTVLDFGCGVGYGSEMLAEAGNFVMAVDASHTALALARERHGSAVAFFCDCDKDFVPSKFDAAVAFEVVEHLEDPEAFLKDMARTSKEIIISTPIVPTMATNPHHKHDFTQDQFQMLVGRYFKTVYEWCQIRPFHSQPTYQVIHGISKGIA